METAGIIVDNLFRGFQKSGKKSRGVLHFKPLWRFYDVLFVPLFCRPREKCGRLWKTTWLHNVDNIRQKDIKLNKSSLTNIFVNKCWQFRVLNYVLNIHYTSILQFLYSMYNFVQCIVILNFLKNYQLLLSTFSIKSRQYNNHFRWHSLFKAFFSLRMTYI